MVLLITGGAGFIGSNLVRYLIETTDHTVLVLDKLTYTGNLDSLTEISHSPRFHFEQTDIVDADAVASAFRKYQPVAVMHLAAESHVDRSIDGPAEFIRTNVVGTYIMLEAARAYFDELPDDRQSRFRFIHVSTDEVYGSLKPDAPAFHESTPYNPHSPYSATKAGSDHLVRSWHATYGLPVIVTNCSNNYGPYQFPEKLIPVVILKALQGESIPVYGQGENIRDWLYVRDHAGALNRVLNAGQLGETYNIGGNNEQQNIDLVRLICRILDELLPCDENPNLADHEKPIASYDQLIAFVKDRPGHDLRYAIDASKIRDALGWRPSEDFESGFRKTVEWYLENQEWWQCILTGDYMMARQGLQQ